MDGGQKIHDQAVCRRCTCGPRPLLLDAYIRGFYAAQVRSHIDNPYPHDPEMAAAWELGWKDAA